MGAFALPIFLLSLSGQNTQPAPTVTLLRILSSLLLVVAAGVIVGTAIASARVPGAVTEFIEQSVAAEAYNPSPRLLTLKGEIPTTLIAAGTWAGVAQSPGPDPRFPKRRTNQSL